MNPAMDPTDDMNEIFKNQKLLIDSVSKKLTEYPEDEFLEIDSIHERAKDYQEKLINVKKSLLLLNEKALRLKKRANKILEVKKKADLERQRYRERQDLLDRHLEPVVNTNNQKPGKNTQCP